MRIAFADNNETSPSGTATNEVTVTMSAEEAALLDAVILTFMNFPDIEEREGSYTVADHELLDRLRGALFSTYNDDADCEDCTIFPPKK